jgi:hypothetical protein
MPSTAIVATGTIVQIATGSGSAKAISAITLGNPTILTLTAHGFSLGDQVTFAAIVGTTQLNGLSTFVQFKTTNTIAVPIDSTGFTAYTSGGTGTNGTYSTIGNAKKISGLDGSSPEIDVTNLASSAEEFLLGLPVGGGISIDLDLDNSDAGQQAARSAQQANPPIKKAFKIILPAGTTPTISFTAFVKKFSVDISTNDALRASIDLRLTGGYTLS